MSDVKDIVNTTIPTSSPSIKLGAHKAVVAAVAGALVAALGVLVGAIDDGAIDLAEAWQILSAGLVGSGIVGSSTYLKSTTVTLK